MKFPIAVLFIILSVYSDLSAQFLEGLLAYYDFNDCTTQEVVDRKGNNNGVFFGAVTPDCTCGIEGEALRLDGINDQVVFLGTFDDLFNTKDFSFSFYIKPRAALGVQDIFSKKKGCNTEHSFSVTYESSISTLTVSLIENASKFTHVSTQLSDDACWSYIGIVREGNKVKLYVDNVLRQEGSAISRVDLSNPGTDLNLCGVVSNPCPNPDFDVVPFAGTIDELKIFKRALRPEEIATLYVFPDKILTPDTLVFVNDPVQIETNSPCANKYNWDPDLNVDDPSSPNPIIRPEETSTYTLSFIQANDCIARDSIVFTVIDPSKLPCDKLFIPKAFTPNGDGLNETFGISNSFVIQQLESFEIFDRWGSRVFLAEMASSKWDGTFRGQEVNPGVFLYRITYFCEGEEIVKSGSLVLMR